MEYKNDFDYLVTSGIDYEVRAISTRASPMILYTSKYLITLYLNDVGILTNILFKDDPNAILINSSSINHSAIYENLVACKLKAHDFSLYNYNNRNKGEVDYLIDDFDLLKTIPIRV